MVFLRGCCVVWMQTETKLYILSVKLGSGLVWWEYEWRVSGVGCGDKWGGRVEEWRWDNLVNTRILADIYQDDNFVTSILYFKINLKIDFSKQKLYLMHNYYRKGLINYFIFKDNYFYTQSSNCCQCWMFVKCSCLQMLLVHNHYIKTSCW